MRAMLLIEQKPVEESPLGAGDIEPPEAGSDEVRIKVSACAVCRTDIHLAEGDLPLHRSPLVPGHQIVGRIDQIGANVAGRQLGDRVTANTRSDARALLAEAAAANIRPQTTLYPLAEANRALCDMKASRVEGTPILM